MIQEPKNSEIASSRCYRHWIGMLALLFILVHAVYYALGFRFDRTTLIEVMHYLDPEMLRTRLAESLWYMHIQPPLFNLFTGLVLKITPESPYLFQLIFLAFGFMFYSATFFLQVRMGVRTRLACVLSTLFMASPSFLLWEHYLLYMMPCAALLTFAALLLFDVVENRSSQSHCGFFPCPVHTLRHVEFVSLGILTHRLVGARMCHP